MLYTFIYYIAVRRNELRSNVFFFSPENYIVYYCYARGPEIGTVTSFEGLASASIIL